MKRMLSVLLVVTVGVVGCTSENPDTEADVSDESTLEADAGRTTPPTPSDDAMPPQRPPEQQIRPDSGVPQKPQQCAEDCGQDQVCAPIGKCVPDCRSTGQCPQSNMICDQQSGLCMGDRPNADGGAQPPLPSKCSGIEDCEEGKVCSPMSTCVPDCRTGLTCPQQLPVCDQETGLCGE